MCWRKTQQDVSMNCINIGRKGERNTFQISDSNKAVVGVAGTEIGKIEKERKLGSKNQEFSFED